MKIEIRPWEPSDNDTFLAWVREDPKILEAMGIEGMDEYEVRRMLVLSFGSPTMRRFMAWRGEDPVAAISIYDVRQDGTAFTSIIANPHGSGFSTLASCKQAAKAFFNGIGIRDLRVIVSETNKAALKLARLMGFEDLNVRHLRLRKEDYDGPGDSTSDR